MVNGRRMLSALVIFSALAFGTTAMAQVKVPSPKSITDFTKKKKKTDDEEDDDKKDSKKKKKKGDSTTREGAKDANREKAQDRNRVTAPKKGSRTPAKDSPAAKTPVRKPGVVDRVPDAPAVKPIPKKAPGKVTPDKPEDRSRIRPAPPGTGVPKPGQPAPDDGVDDSPKTGGGGGGGCCGCGMCFGALCPCADCDWRCEVGGIVGGLTGGLLGGGVGILAGYSIAFFQPEQTRNTVMFAGLLLGGVGGLVVGGVTGASLGMLSSGLNPARLFSGVGMEEANYGLQE